MKRLQGLMLVIFFLAATPALMAQRGMKATLEGGSEVPKAVTGAYGTFVGTISADGLSIDFSLVISNIGTELTASHIHFGAEGVAGPAVLSLFIARDEGKWKGKKVGTVTAADFKPTQAWSDVGVYSFADMVDNILRGNAYVNAHTTKFPVGEIRGHLKVAETR